MCEDVSCDHSVFKLIVEINKGRIHLDKGTKAQRESRCIALLFL